MTGLQRPLRGLSLLALAALAACSSKPAPVEVAAAPPPPPPPPPPAPRPVPPALVPFEHYATPPVGSDGRYVTINSSLAPQEMVWHLRSALNVAAIACRGPEAVTLAANYNGLLKVRKKQLAAAYSATRKQHSDYDAHVTRIYNFFSQEPAREGFCATAYLVSAEALNTDPAVFENFAAMALTRLEAPFIAVFDAHIDYRRRLAAWEAGNPSSATTVTVPVAATQAGVPGWRVQLGAFANEDQARQAWNEARNVSGFTMLEPSFQLEPTRQMVRLQAGPVKDRETASALCAAASAAGRGCFPVAPGL